MQAAGIPFIVRLVPNRKIYKDLAAEHIDGLEDAKYMVRYGQRLVFIKQVPISLFGKAGFAYIAVDMDRKHDEIRRYALSALDDGDVPDDKINEEMRYKGMFILLSAQNILLCGGPPPKNVKCTIFETVLRSGGWQSSR